MKPLQSICIVVTVLAGLGLCHREAIAAPQGFSVDKRVGVGIFSNFLNFGIGPSGEFWATDNFGLMLSVGGGGNFLSFSGRGQFLFSSPMPMAQSSARPYLGVGYARVQGPDTHWHGITAEAAGQGIEVFAGCLHNAEWLHEQVFLRAEVGYSTVEIKAKASAAVYGQTLETEIGADYRAFTINLGISYFF